MTQKRSILTAVLLGTVAVLMSTVAVRADAVFTFDFDINSIEGDTDLPGSQFQLEIFEVTGGLGEVEFKISNLDQEGAIESSIYRIYWDDYASVLDMLVYADPDFGLDSANPNNLRGGVNVGFSADFGVDVEHGRDFQDKAIGVGESASFIFTLDGIYFADVLEALVNGDLRVGIDVGGIGNGGRDSDSFVNAPSSVPEPSTLILLLSGTTLLAGAARFRKKT